MFIDAARRVATTTSYVILVAIATSFSLRVAAVLVSRRLAIAATPQRRPRDGQLNEQAVRRDHDVVDDVSDDDGDDVSCNYDVTELRDDAPLPPSVSTRQYGILHSLKFYETNV